MVKSCCPGCRVHTWFHNKCVFTFWVLCCDGRYDFHTKTMFGSSLPPVVCRRVDVLFTLFVFPCVVVSNTYCVVFLFCFSLPCVHYCASFSGLSIFDSLKILIWYSPTFINIVLTFLSALHKHEIFDTINTVVSNHFHSVKILLFSVDHMISMECSALGFRCQCT